MPRRPTVATRQTRSHCTSSATDFLSFMEDLPVSIGVKLDRIAVRILDVDRRAAAPSDHFHPRGLHAPAENREALRPDIETEVIETAGAEVDRPSDPDEIQ